MIATAIGSVPGDFLEASRRSVEIFDTIAFFPEIISDIPQGMIGRLSAIMPIGCEYRDGSWNLSASSSRLQRALAQQLDDQLELFAQIAQGYSGAIKIAFSGVWTYAACVQRGYGSKEKALMDKGALKDLTQGIAEGITGVISRLSQLLSSPLIVQIDEPYLDAIIKGKVPTFSKLHRYPPYDPALIGQALVEIVDRLRRDSSVQTWLHLCCPLPDVDAIYRPFDGISCDLRYVSGADRQRCAAWLDEGKSLVLGAVPTDADQVVNSKRLNQVASWCESLSIATDILLDKVILTPSCGLALSTEQQAWTMLEQIPHFADELHQMLCS